MQGWYSGSPGFRPWDERTGVFSYLRITVSALAEASLARHTRPMSSAVWRT